MQSLFFFTLLLIMLSCKKETNCGAPQYIPPLVADSIFKRAYTFTYHTWNDAAVVSHTDNSLLFEIESKSQERNKDSFQLYQVNKDAIKADSEIFFDQHHRSELVDNVKMHFSYMLTDTTFHFTYSLTNTIFKNHY